MTSIFDGMASALNDVFGAPVTYWTSYGEELSVQGIFREEPVEVGGADGVDALIMQPTLKVPVTLADHLKRGIQIEGPDGRLFRIVNRHRPQVSPASDRFAVFELELVSCDP